MFNAHFHLSVGLLLLFCTVASGCKQNGSASREDANRPSNESKHAHDDLHDTPLTEAEINRLREETKSWPAAVARIQALRDTVQQETTVGQPAAAHRALDELDYVLQWIPEIVQDSNVPKEHWQAIGEHVQTLRDAFDNVHANIDAGQDPGYPSVANKIDQAIGELAAIPSGAVPPGDDTVDAP